MLFVFLVILVIAALVLFLITRIKVSQIARHHYLQRGSFFAAHPAEAGDVVFLGDSLTAGANWDELFPGVPIRNRGINADTTTGLLERLDPATFKQAAAIFLLIGTNDLPWYVYHSDENILQAYQIILERIHKDAPQAHVYVESLLPRSHEYAGRIRMLNPRLKTLAQSQGDVYIDLYPLFADANGDLRADLNNDHIHLLAEGYALWAEALRPYLEPYRRC